MKKKAILLIPSVLLLAALLLLIMGDSSADICSAVVTSAQGEEEITCWEAEDGHYYLFLPGYAKLSDVRFILHTETPVAIGDNTLFDGMSCESFSLNNAYDFVYYDFGQRQERKITFVQSGGVATMYIDTQSGSMEFIHKKKGNEESGDLCLYTKGGAVDFTGKIKSINGRGNITWTDKEKKPYSLTLEAEADLLGMGSAQKWILLANAFDSSNLRNKIVYDYAKKIGLKYTPDAQWVDLYLNGEYTGLYLLCERNEIHPERVAISEAGSMLVSLELEERLVAQNYPHIKTNSGQALRIHYMDTMHEEDLLRKWQSVENALISENGIDDITGKSWIELIDMESWAKKYLLEEVVGNVDAGYISQYFYQEGNDENALIYAGPVWDYDSSMGNKVVWQIGNPNSFLADRLQVTPTDRTPWMYYLCRREVFYEKVVDLYRDTFRPLWVILIEEGLDKYAGEIVEASLCNQIRWLSKEDNIYINTADIKEYMRERIAFFDSVWLNGCSYHTVSMIQSYGGFYAYVSVEDGMCIDQLPNFDDTEIQMFQGWYYSDTNEPFDITKPITEDIEIYGKWEDKATKKINQILKLIPLGVIAIMGLGLLTADVRKSRRV